MQPNLDIDLERTISSGQLRAIVEQIADGIIVVDGAGVICFVNPAAADLLGRPADVLLGAEFGYPVMPSEHAEIEILDGRGGVRYGELRVVPITWANAPAHLIALRDSTALRQAQQILRDAEAFNWAVLNSLSNHLAVLNRQGEIIAVNDAWRAFARQNGDPELRYTGVGVNYFAICQAARGDDSAEARQVAIGLRAVLDGALPAFELEYPCHSPTEERWFLLRAVPFQGGRRAGLVVSHTNITAQRRTARIEAEAAALRAKERELHHIECIGRPAPAGPGAAPLQERDPTAFARAVQQYRALLEAALLRRAYGGVEAPAISARALAAQLSMLWATPRDIITIHLSGFRASTADVPAIRAQAAMDEARVVVLELMGHLAAYYRARARNQGDVAAP